MAINQPYIPKRGPKPVEYPHRINSDIDAPVVRLVGDDFEPGFYPVKDALTMAVEREMDLVEIAPNASPPVCKIMDYKKFLYELKKKTKEKKSKSAKIVVKEIRLGPNTDDHDFNFKVKHAMKFLQDGAKVKVEVLFKGRSIVYKDSGELLMLKFAQEVSEHGKLEQLPKLEGKRMMMIIGPKKVI